MKTHQLKFLAWTFSAFLPPDDPGAEDVYALLGVAPGATPDDVKKAYRRRSLQLHPDKLRQRGMVYEGQAITEGEARARFQAMKAAYDVLRDPRKREIYDALGHKGLDFVINPSHAWDPHILLGNLAKSSVFDRAKLISLVLLFVGAVLLQPILVCAKVDQMLDDGGGALENSSWGALLVPFWLFAALYGVLLVIGRAALPLFQWSCFVTGVVFLALKFDDVVSWDYAILFVPFYVWMVLRLYGGYKETQAVKADMSRMATVEYIEKYVLNEMRQDENGNDLEHQLLERRYDDLSEEERDEINKKYIIVHVPPQADGGEEEDDLDRIERSPEYLEAKARLDYASKSIHRIVIPEIPLLVLITIQLDTNRNWNWGLTFLPLWISMFFDCCGGCYGFLCTSALAHIEVQEAMAEHFAKEQESKQQDANDDNGGEAKGNVEMKPEVTAKLEGTVSGETAETEKAAGAEDEHKSRAKDVAVVDTAIDVPTETTQAKTEEGDPHIEVRIPDEGNPHIEVKIPGDEDEGDDGDVMFEMDEDTYNYYQQAEQEAENKATEAQSKAVGSFCNIIFQIIVAALFVGKLNQVYEAREEPEMDGTGSFSAFWILFPVLAIAGCIVCCFACAIFGADSIDSAMSSDDASDAAGDKGAEEGARAGDNPPVAPTPPLPQGESGVIDKNDDESTSKVSESVENAGDGTAEAADADRENAMDDLD